MCESEMAKLMRSIQQFGMVEPLVVRRSDRLVVGGNQRLEAARALGLEQAPVVLVELSDAEAKALNLALNKIQGTWDLPRLGPSPTWAASTGDLHLAHPRHAGGRARCLRP
jgi:ParB-like chromosome segregation protein Spo0J